MNGEHKEQCEQINGNTDEKIMLLEGHINDYSRRLDRHLEIYAQNGKELNALKTRVTGMETKVEKVYDMGEALLQQISGVGSDVKNIQIKFTEFAGLVSTLQADKTNRDGWVTWFLRTVFGVILMAILLAIGISVK